MSKKPVQPTGLNAQDFLCSLQAELGRALPPVSGWVSTGSPALDRAVAGDLGAGLPLGRISEIYGTESVGKSTILEHVFRSARQAGGVVVDLDVEATRNEGKLRRLGLTPADFCYVSPPINPKTKQPGSWSMEQVLELLRTILRRLAGAQFLSVLGWDSVAATPPQCEVDGDLGEQRFGPASRLLAEGMRQLPWLLAQANAALVIINQLKTRKDGWTEVESSFAGSPVRFHATVRIKLQIVGQIKSDAGYLIGHQILATVTKNKLSPPMRKVVLPHYFDTGIHAAGSVLATLVDHKLVLASGPWTVVKTRTKEVKLHLQPEKRYVMWQDLVDKDPALLAEALDLLWHPAASAIIRGAVS
jgi:recombination protein RecA